MNNAAAVAPTDTSLTLTGESLEVFKKAMKIG